MSESNYPVFKLRSGNISAAVFEGRYGRSIVLQRSVYNKETKAYRYEKINILSTQCLEIGFVAQEALRWCITNPEDKPDTSNNSEHSEAKQNDDYISF